MTGHKSDGHNNKTQVMPWTDMFIIMLFIAVITLHLVVHSRGRILPIKNRIRITVSPS